MEVAAGAAGEEVAPSEEVLVEHMSPLMPPPTPPIATATDPAAALWTEPPSITRPTAVITSLGERQNGRSGPRHGLPSIALPWPTWAQRSPPSSLLLAEGGVGVVVAFFCLCGLICAVRRTLVACSRYRRHRLLPGSEVAAESGAHRNGAESAAETADALAIETHDRAGIRHSGIRKSGRVSQTQSDQTEYELD